MAFESMTKNRRLAIYVSGALLVAGLIAAGWWWQQKRAMDDIVGPGLILINYTDDDVHTYVHYSKFPNPGQGAYSETGPGSGGGGLDCCVPIPTIWRPGIKMIVRYHFGKWPKGKEKTKLVELPEYPDGRPGSLYLVFHSETELELMSTMFGPRHPRWPGRRIEPIMQGVE